MVWRLRNKDYIAGKGARNRNALRRIVQSGKRPGVIGYVARRPVAWCAVAPREEYPALSRSRVLAPFDDQRVWSISCLFVLKSMRRRGISVRMLEAAVAHAAARGARVVEGYPVEPHSADAPGPFIWTGTASAFREAGFREVIRRSRTRPIMRRRIRAKP
jgi:GNAT superfamily N-acetyltransferase